MEQANELLLHFATTVRTNSFAGSHNSLLELGDNVIGRHTAAKEQIETELAALSDNISVLKEQLKSKKSALKVAVKELSKAEAKKVAAEKKAAEESKKAEAESVLKKLLASGMSADEIIAKLQ